MGTDHIGKIFFSPGPGNKAVPPLLKFSANKPQAVRLSVNSYRIIALLLLLLGFVMFCVALFFFSSFFLTAALTITNWTAKSTAVLFWKFTTYSAQTRKWGVVLLKADIQKRVFLTHDLQWTGIPLLKISSLPWTSLPKLIPSQLREKWHIMEKNRALRDFDLIFLNK